MWHRLSIRWQLISLLTLVLSVVVIATLAFTYWSDVRERKAMALEQVETLGRALKHDLVRALVNPQADVYSDISFRLSGFESVAALAVLNNTNEEVYRHVRQDTEVPEDFLSRGLTEPYFSRDYLYSHQMLQVEGYTFGEVVYLIDLASYRTGLREQLLGLLTIFPLELAICLVLAVWLGRTYTRPFTELAQAMDQADVRHNRYPQVQTRQENEIGVLYHGYNEMIQQIKHVTGELTFLSQHDALTGLYNRYAMEQAIIKCLQDDTAGSHVLLSLDVDQFKLVNDSAGHVAGNELLKQIGRICQNSLPDSAMIARVGGDDFFVLFPGATEKEGVRHTKTLLHNLRDFRFTWEGEIFSVSACIGLLAFKPFEYTLQAIQTAVDSAFYAAKAKGHHQLHVYRPDDDKVQQYNADIHAAAIIREALDDGPSSFELYAQAIVPLQHSSDQISYEVLLRLRNPAGAIVSPDTFLPTANRYQLMADIDCFVLWDYLRTVTKHPEHIEHLAFVNINLAGASLNNNVFQTAVHAAIETFNFPWHKLVLEVTETSAVGNLAKASGFIDYVRGMGIRVALDDFGTGMASFEYLKHLPLDIVKIDGSFIRDMLTDPIDHAMVSYAHQISKLRGQQTIAEFIEQEEHVQELKSIGIDYGQGFYLGRPKPLMEWVADSQTLQSDTDQQQARASA